MARRSIVAERNKTPERFDIPFALLTLLLCGIGLTALYSGTVGYGERLFADPLYFVKRQSINLVAGFMVMVLFATVNLDFVRKILPQLVIATMVLSLLPFVPGLGIVKNGAARWIGLGFATFQPSELVKLVVVVYLANLFDKKHDHLDEPRASIIPAVVTSGLFVTIIFLQNDFSTAIFVLLVVLLLFLLGGIPLVWFVRFAAVCFPVAALMILTEEYRLERILSFLNPDKDPLGAGYQVNAALSALAEGGFWGRGLGNGVRKIMSIPEVQSDFIFAVWGEEMGFFGVCVYFALLLAFSARGFLISLRAGDRFRFLLGFGCTAIIFFQSLMNCGVVVRAFPATGVPLPFFSSGGSSLLITLCLCGFIINVSRSRPEEEMQDVTNQFC